MQQQIYQEQLEEIGIQEKQINIFQELLNDKQLFILLYEKYGLNFERIAEIRCNQSNIACYRNYAENLYMRSLYFLEKWMLEAMNKTILGLTFEKIQKIVHLLIANNETFLISLRNLQQKLKKIMKYLYLKQPITFEYLQETAFVLEKMVKDCNLLYKSKFTASSELITFSRPQIIVSGQRVVQSKVQSKQQEDDSFSRLIKNPAAQNMFKSASKIKKSMELVDQNWLPQQLQKAIQLYLATQHNQFSSIAFELRLLFKNKQKFTQTKVTSKLNIAMRAGLSILKQFQIKHNINKTRKEIVINTHISKIILQCRSNIITHQIKKAILQLNIRTDFSEEYMFSLLEKVTEFMYANFTQN